MQPSTSDQKDSTNDFDAWLALDYPLSVTEIKRLGWLQTKMAAVVFLANPDDDTVDLVFAQRLAFTRYLFTSGRLSEHAGVQP